MNAIYRYVFINVIKNWYDKLTSVVKWNPVFSMHAFCSQKRSSSGGILSPILFDVYVNDLVNNLVDEDCGCHVGSVFFRRFIYADDIILLSYLLIGLQAMLNICTCYGNDGVCSWTQTRLSWCGLHLGLCLRSSQPRTPLWKSVRLSSSLPKASEISVSL